MSSTCPTVMSRSRSSSARDSAPTSSTDSSSRCSVASTPVTPTSSRCRRRRRRSPLSAAICSPEPRRPELRRLPPGPVFAGLVGGVGQLPDAVADGIEVRLDATVREIARTADGWQLSVGPTTDVEAIDVDAVVVAAPAPAAARLLAEVAPDAAFALAAIDYASVAIVTYVFDDGPDVRGLRLPGAAGRRHVHQGRDGLVQQVGMGRRHRPYGHPRLGRPRRRGNPAAERRRRPHRSGTGRPAHGIRRLARAARLASSSAGEADCRSTPSATSTASTRSSATSPRCRGSRSAVPPTAASASPP